MQYSEMQTATLRTAFASVYVANIIAAILHFGYGYLDVLASIIIIVFAACMLMVTMQIPEKIMVYFEMTAPTVLSWRFRMIGDVIQILFLVAQGFLGDVMAIVTGVSLFVAFTLAQKRPDIFRELFRKHAGDPEMGGEGDDAYQEASAPPA